MIPEPYKIELQEVPDPGLPAEDEVLIKVSVTGICGSEVHAFRGTHPWRVPPVISGHEMAGQVVQVGAKVTSVSVGDRVTVEPHVGCGTCYYCKAGLYNLCLKKRILGTPEWVGSFAEYIKVPEKTVLKLPDQVDNELGALTEPLAVGMHAIRVANLQPGETIVVLGAGPIGLAVVLAARLARAGTIVVTDAMDFNLQVARLLGADRALNIKTEDIAGTVKGDTGGLGADCVAIAVGLEPVLKQALQLVRRGGRIVEIGLFDTAPRIEISKLQVGEIGLLGCNMYTRMDFEQVLNALRTGSVDARPLITHVLPIERVAEGIEMVEKKLDNSIKVLLQF